MSLKTEVITVAKNIFTKQNITEGLPGEVQCAIVRDVILETIFTDYGVDALEEAKANAVGTAPESDENKALTIIVKTRADLYALIYPLLNNSALRQKFEDAGMLKKTATGKRNANAEVLANKYV